MNEMPIPDDISGLDVAGQLVVQAWRTPAAAPRCGRRSWPELSSGRPISSPSRKP